jgi:hypothetical protein
MDDSEFGGSSFEERLATQPQRSVSSWGGLLMIISTLGVVVLATVGWQAMKDHFLNSEMEASKKTIVYESTVSPEGIAVSRSITAEYSRRAELQSQAFRTP